MPYRGHPLNRLEQLLQQGAEHTVKRLGFKEPIMRVIFTQPEVLEMQRLVRQLQEAKTCVPSLTAS